MKSTTSFVSVLGLFLVYGGASLGGCATTTSPVFGDDGGTSGDDGGVTSPHDGSTSHHDGSSTTPDSGPGPGNDSGPTSMCGGYGSSKPACNSCFQSSCCTQGTTCGNNAECGALLQCAAACQDQTCVNTCASMHQAGVADLQAMETCLKNSCNAQCNGTTDGGTPPPADGGMGCGVMTQNPTCNTCLDTSCCAQGQACGNATGNECLNLSMCYSQCAQSDGGTACDNNCDSQHPNGVTPLNNLGQCLQTSCSTTCP
jgi:hypothetical protein